MVDDTNLAQCQYCKVVINWEDVEYVSDPYCSDGTVTRCAECNEGESFNNYKGDKHDHALPQV